MKSTLKYRINRTIIIIAIFVSLSTIAQTQPLQNFTAKEGLDFAFSQGRKLLGDSVKLYKIASNWGDHPDSYNNKGLSRIWVYAFRNSDSSYVMAINRQNDTFFMKYYQKVYSSIGTPIPLDLIKYYSDSTYELSKKCCPYVEKRFCSQYVLEMYENNHPYWINYFLEDTLNVGRAYSLITVYLDAFTGECDYIGTDVKDKLAEIIDENSISISPNPAFDFIEISVGTRRAVSEQSDIKIFNVFGQNVYPTPALPASEEGVRIDVSSLAPGMYFVRIGDRVGKFLKM